MLAWKLGQDTELATEPPPAPGPAGSKKSLPRRCPPRDLVLDVLSLRSSRAEAVLGSPLHLPSVPSSPRRRLARAVIAFVVALVVAIPALRIGLVDAAVLFGLCFAVTWGALLLVTNP